MSLACCAWSYQPFKGVTSTSSFIRNQCAVLERAVQGCLIAASTTKRCKVCGSVTTSATEEQARGTPASSETVRIDKLAGNQLASAYIEGNDGGLTKH